MNAHDVFQVAAWSHRPLAVFVVAAAGALLARIVFLVFKFAKSGEALGEGVTAGRLKVLFKKTGRGGEL